MLKVISLLYHHLLAALRTIDTTGAASHGPGGTDQLATAPGTGLCCMNVRPWRVNGRERGGGEAVQGRITVRSELWSLGGGRWTVDGAGGRWTVVHL